MLYTKIASTLLFFVCSVLMVREAMLSQPSVSDNSPSGPAFSSSSVHMEREQDGSRSLTSILSTADDVGDDNADDDDKNKSYPPNHGHLLFSKSFILTFIAEWGDRSQLATIALATSKVCFFLRMFTCSNRIFWACLLAPLRGISYALGLPSLGAHLLLPDYPSGKVLHCHICF